MTIEEIIRRDNGILEIKKAIIEGFTKDKIYTFIRLNNLEKTGHGIYVLPESWVDECYMLHLRCPHAVFSHDEALYYHGLIDREPVQHTVTVYTGYNTNRLSADGIKVYTVRRDLVEVGKKIVRNDFQNQIPMYDLERTVVDLIRNRNNFEIQDFQTALRNYTVRYDKDLNLLMSYAKLFRVDNVLRRYMEVLI
ncbi:MAG: abortive phage infection protein [Phascolarctobacterium sp.]|nr:abortive phage infection protein [Phascolarctobacterium sp.]